MSYNVNGALFGGNINFSKAGITGFSGAAVTFSTAAAINYTIGGKWQTQKAIISTTAVPTTDVVTGAGFKALLADQACTFVFTLDGSCNVGVAQGPVPVQPTTLATVKSVDDSGNFNFIPQFPAIPDTLTPFAYVVVRTQSTIAASGFVFGTTNWNATGVVIAGSDDIAVLPAVPQVS